MYICVYVNNYNSVYLVKERSRHTKSTQCLEREERKPFQKKMRSTYIIADAAVLELAIQFGSK